MNNKGIGSIFCLIAAILMAARYMAAAMFMSNVSSWDAGLFASGLEYIGPELKIASIIALIVGIVFLGAGIYQDIKEKEMSNPLKELSTKEWCLWIGSLLIVTVSNRAAGQLDYLTLIATSFLAASLTMLRSSYYAMAYAANDLVLIVLWSLAAIKNPVYIPVIVNFSIFFINDTYGFLSWRKRERIQISLAK